MKLQSIRRDKGVAGLTVFLSLIVMVFIIGLLVMIFSLMGGSLSSSTTDATAKSVIANTTGSVAKATTYFDLFIVIGAMVTIILLTVLIIVAIRGSGIMSSSE